MTSCNRFSNTCPYWCPHCGCTKGTSPGLHLVKPDSSKSYKIRIQESPSLQGTYGNLEDTHKDFKKKLEKETKEHG